MERGRLSHKYLVSVIEHEGEKITPLFELAKIWAKRVFPAETLEPNACGYSTRDGIFDCVVTRKKTNKKLLFYYEEGEGFSFNLLIKRFGVTENNREVPHELQLRLVEKAKEFGMNLKIKEV